ncbi:MAG: class I SAM-dependent methyltransferase [Thermoplasmata archaeon]|nr:class I SAM-dependent methyltransferase [Thermoplasmata archaeon]
MPVFAAQCGNPHGLLGRLVGFFLARSNADFNHWIARELQNEWHEQPARIVELGPGPGIGLEQMLRLFPHAKVWGVDLSPEMLAQSRRRNPREVEAGRLTLLNGGVASLAELGPLDLVLAVHVIYFWHRPEPELSQIHASLRSGGLLALGFQLRQHMPRMVQKNFPREGHILYDSEDDVTRLLREAGFATVRYLVKGALESPEGRLALAVA